ncbi:MAG: sigma-70 family RNA polymerase sigma factor [bacterium]|nr:sigma-70 family RNA polymerase sigma factor [bacterium]
MARTFNDHYLELCDDVAAWARIHARNPAVRGLDGDDLIQETWGRAFASFDRFKPDRGSFRAWLFGIGYNVLRQQLRHLGNKVHVAGRERADLAEMLDDGTSVATRLWRSERARKLVAIVEKLPEQDRLLVLYRGLEGLSHAEVGARLDLKSEAAEMRWRRVRSKLAGLVPE